MKLVIITPNIPYPLSEGGKVAQFSIIDAIRIYVNITLVLICNSDHDKSSIDELLTKWPNVDIRFLDQRPAPPKKTSKNSALNALRRIKRLVIADKLIEEPKEDEQTKFLHELEQSKQMYNLKDRETISYICNTIDEIKPDLIQIELLPFIDLVYSIPSRYKKIFVHHELRFARVETLLKTQKQPSPYDNYLYDYIKNTELNLLEQYDGIVVYSEGDKTKLSPHLKRPSILSNGFPVPDDAFKIVKKEDLNITKLVFLGGEGHYPNVDAFEWYVNDIAPRVIEKFNLCLHVIGSWSTETINKYAGNTAVKFAGFIEDLADYCRNSIMLVPVRVGSGIRTKILYAMAQGTPIISASVGCEGIIGKNEEDFLIADTPENYVDAIQRLTGEPSFTLNMVHTAQSTAKKFYSQKAAGDVRLSYLKEICNQ